MSDLKKKSSNKALKVVNFRNRFLYVFYRFANLIFFCSLILAISSVSFFIFFLKKPVPPQYIPIDSENKVIPLPFVNEKTKQDSEIIDFSIRALKKIYTYDYVNYAEQIQEGSYFFEDPAWNIYLTYLTDSQTLDFVKKNSLVSSFKVVGAPSVYESKVEEGAYIWKVKIPIQITYVGKTGIIQDGIAHVKVRRVSVIQNPEGINIEAFVLEQKTDKIKETVGASASQPTQPVNATQESSQNAK